MTILKKTLSLILLCSILFGISGKVCTAQEWTVYNTSDGLCGNSVWFIDEDRKGYLWFTTAFFDGASRYDGILFQNLNTTQGLASNNIYFTMADRSGNFWFATDRGVSKYDGITFHNYDVSDGLSDNIVTFILEERGGNVWFATDRGVSKYDGKSFQTIGDAAGNTEIYVTYILEDGEGNIWFGTDKGVRKHDGKNLLPVSAAKLSHSVQIIFEDKEGNLWFGTAEGLYRKSAGSQEIEGPLIEADIFSILEDQNRNLWFATGYQGVIKHEVRDGTFVTQSGLVDNRILSMLMDGKGNIWFGTDKGISQYNGQGFQNFEEINGAPVKFVRSILEDPDENLWFATENGICKYTRKNLEHFTAELGLASNVVHSILEDREGNLLFGTENGVSIYDGKEFKSIPQRDRLTDNRVLSIYQDGKGDIWFGTSSGLEKNLHSENREHVPMNTAVRSILEDEKGNLWLATTEGMNKYDGKAIQTIPIENGLEMFMDISGNVWMGSWNTGLYKYNDVDGLGCYNTEDGLSSNHVLWIRQTHDSNLWFGLKGDIPYNGSDQKVSGGVCCFDGVSFKNFSTDDGLLSNSVNHALEDLDGNLWFGTDKGVIQVDSGSTDGSLQFRAITKQHGLISNYVTSMLADREGNLWIGTDKGVSKFDGENFQNIPLEEELALGFIETILEDKKGDMWFITSNNGVIRYCPPAKEILPRIYVTQIEVDRVYSQNISNIRVPTSANLITFEYKAISFKTKPEKMRFTYKLEGHDENWLPSTNERRVHYENLRPGSYQFRVRGIDKDLHYSEPPATVDMMIFRPFYKSTVFVIIVILTSILLLGGAGYLVIHSREQRRIAAQFREKLLKQQEAERIQAAKMESLRQLVAGVAHELNTPIGAISSNNDVSERAVSRIKEMLIKEYAEGIQKNTRLMGALEVLETTSQTSKKASERIAKIIANLRSFVRLDEAEWDVIDIHQEINRVIDLLEPEFEGRTKVIKDYGDISKVYCSPSSLNQVFMAIIRNANEAIEKQGEIRIRTFALADTIKIEFTDTGIGIPAENISRIFDPGFTTKGVRVGVGLGLAICYDIITERHNGSIDVSSEKGKGTTITLTLPQHRDGVKKGTKNSES